MIAKFQKAFLAFIVILFLSSIFVGCVGNLSKNESPAKNTNSKLKIFVTILPQKEFAQNVAGDKAEVFVMIPPGFNPATYEPKPSQLASLNQAQAYFLSGKLPFENTQLTKFQSIAPDMKIFDTSIGVEYRLQDEQHIHEETPSEQAKNIEQSDPHIWLSPELAQTQITNIAQGMAQIDPVNAQFYQNNAKNYQGKLKKLDQELAQILSPLKGQTILVYHGAFGYFADHYGLKQLVIEEAGKSPSPAKIKQIIQKAKENQVKVIFTQAQFDTKTAQVIADEIEGAVVSIDPLAPNYLENMQQIAQTIKEKL